MVTLLFNKFRRLYDITLDWGISFAVMVVEENGLRVVNWNWRRKLFHCKEELVEVCQEVAAGVKKRRGRMIDESGEEGGT